MCATISWTLIIFFDYIGSGFIKKNGEKMSISEIFEGLTTVGLFISVILVFIELRRNGTSTRLNNNLIFTERHFNFRNLTINKDTADVIVRGRKGLDKLDEAEKLLFANYLLNTAQTASVMLLAGEGQLASTEIVKLQAARIIKDEWDTIGGREYWDQIKNDAPVVPHVRAGIAQVLD